MRKKHTTGKVADTTLTYIILLAVAFVFFKVRNHLFLRRVFPAGIQSCQL